MASWVYAPKRAAALPRNGFSRGLLRPELPDSLGGPEPASQRGSPDHGQHRYKHGRNYQLEHVHEKRLSRVGRTKRGSCRTGVSADLVRPSSQVSRSSELGTPARSMEAIWCQGCGSEWFSSAARSFTEHGACPSCGDRLVATQFPSPRSPNETNVRLAQIRGPLARGRGTKKHLPPGSA